MSLNHICSNATNTSLILLDSSTPQQDLAVTLTVGDSISSSFSSNGFGPRRSQVSSRRHALPQETRTRATSVLLRRVHGGKACSSNKQRHGSIPPGKRYYGRNRSSQSPTRGPLSRSSLSLASGDGSLTKRPNQEVQIPKTLVSGIEANFIAEDTTPVATIASRLPKHILWRGIFRTSSRNHNVQRHLSHVSQLSTYTQQPSPEGRHYKPPASYNYSSSPDIMESRYGQLPKKDGSSDVLTSLQRGGFFNIAFNSLIRRQSNHNLASGYESPPIIDELLPGVVRISSEFKSSNTERPSRPKMKGNFFSFMSRRSSGFARTYSKFHSGEGDPQTNTQSQSRGQGRVSRLPKFFLAAGRKSFFNSDKENLNDETRPRWRFPGYRKESFFDNSPSALEDRRCDTCSIKDCCQIHDPKTSCSLCGPQSREEGERQHYEEIYNSDHSGKKVASVLDSSRGDSNKYHVEDFCLEFPHPIPQFSLIACHSASRPDQEQQVSCDTEEEDGDPSGEENWPEESSLDSTKDTLGGSPKEGGITQENSERQELNYNSDESKVLRLGSDIKPNIILSTVADSTPNINLHSAESLHFQLPSNWDPVPSTEPHRTRLGLKIGGGTPTQGTRQRIRARVSVGLDEFDEEADFPEDILQGALADGLFVSEEEVQEIRRSVWVPHGDNIPPANSVTLGYHTAWDIGKKGCIALKLRHDWESSVNPSRLRFFIMDGTDPYSFLCYYTKTDLKEDVPDVQRKKGVLGAIDLLTAEWNYSTGRIRILRRYRGGKIFTIDRLPQHFMDAMYICLREMEVVREVNLRKTQRIIERQAQEKQKKANRRISMLPSDARRPSENGSYTYGDNGANGSFISSRYPSGGVESLTDPSMAIGATRKTARAMVIPNSGVVASIIASSIKKKSFYDDSSSTGKGGRCVGSRRRRQNSPMQSVPATDVSQVTSSTISSYISSNQNHVDPSSGLTSLESSYYLDKYTELPPESQIIQDIKSSGANASGHQLDVSDSLNCNRDQSSSFDPLAFSSLIKPHSASQHDDPSFLSNDSITVSNNQHLPLTSTPSLPIRAPSDDYTNITPVPSGSGTNVEQFDQIVGTL